MCVTCAGLMDVQQSSRDNTTYYSHRTQLLPHEAPLHNHRYKHNHNVKCWCDKYKFRTLTIGATWSLTSLASTKGNNVLAPCCLLSVLDWLSLNFLFLSLLIWGVLTVPSRSLEWYSPVSSPFWSLKIVNQINRKLCNIEIDNGRVKIFNWKVIVNCT